jgi:putative spermidine/putrescine transport system substrate-binding protein
VKSRLVDFKKDVLSFYTTADEAQQIYQNNDVALIWRITANSSSRPCRSWRACRLCQSSEGALSWLDNWAMTSGVKDKAAAEKWVNFLLQKKIATELSNRTGFGNTVVASGSANESDKLVWLETVEDPLKRSDLWNEVKAAP